MLCLVGCSVGRFDPADPPARQRPHFASWFSHSQPAGACTTALVLSMEHQRLCENKIDSIGRILMRLQLTTHRPRNPQANLDFYLSHHVKR